MSSDLRAWVESVTDDPIDRALVALHEGPLSGRCPVCSTFDTFEGDPFALPLLKPAPWPCETVRLVASRYRDRPGFRPGWAATREEVQS